jgi:hypothetical protein
MKTKFSLLSLLVLTTLFLLNCSDDPSSNTNTPVVKKYYISTVKKNNIIMEEYTYNTDFNLIKYQITDSNGVANCDFSYNSSGVLTDLALSSSSLSIGGVIVEMNSSKNPAKAIKCPLSDSITYTFEYNVAGYLTKINYFTGSQVLEERKNGFRTLTYDTKGNVTREVLSEYPVVVNSAQYDYVYDLKNSPFNYSQLKWPYFLVMNFLSINGYNLTHFLSKSNIIKITKTIPPPTVVTNYTYLYNTDGYPTQMVQGSDVYDITYIVK